MSTTATQVLRGSTNQFASVSRRNTDVGACSKALATLPAVTWFADPDASLSYPSVQERVTGSPPLTLEGAQGQLVGTGSYLGSHRMFSFDSSHTRGLQFYDAACTVDQTLISAVFPAVATLQGAYEAGVMLVEDTTYVPQRQMRLTVGGGVVYANAYAVDLNGNGQQIGAPIAVNNILAVGRLSVMVAVFSYTRQVMELYIDNMAAPIATGAFVGGSGVPRGFVELGGYTGNFASWKGFIGRSLIASTDLAHPQNKPALTAAVAALQAYYNGSGT